MNTRLANFSAACQLRHGLPLLACLLLAACATTPHPLQERIWHAEQQRFISDDELIAALADSHYILLGEIHGERAHHEFQATLIDALAEHGRRPVVAMEMIDSTQAAVLHDYLDSGEATVEGLAEVLRWEDSGWPAWSLYQPVAAATLHHQLPLVDANRPRHEVREVAREGLSSLDADERAELGLDQPLPESAASELDQRLREAHAAHLSADSLPTLLDAQRLRDAHMALRLRQADRGDGVILITGNAHASNRHGVPWYLRQAGESSIFSLGQLPVSTGDKTPADYPQHFDALRFTSPRSAP